MGDLGELFSKLGSSGLLQMLSQGAGLGVGPGAFGSGLIGMFNKDENEGQAPGAPPAPSGPASPMPVMGANPQFNGLSGAFGNGRPKLNLWG